MIFQARNLTHTTESFRIRSAFRPHRYSVETTSHAQDGNCPLGLHWARYFSTQREPQSALRSGRLLTRTRLALFLTNLCLYQSINGGPGYRFLTYHSQNKDLQWNSPKFWDRLSIWELVGLTLPVAQGWVTLAYDCKSFRIREFIDFTRKSAATAHFK